MITIINILFFIAFIYWVYFLWTAGKDERGRIIGFYSSVAAIGVLVLGITILDLYSNYNEISLEDFKLWLNMSYRMAIITTAIVTFTIDRFFRI